jgi:hypothetical protein
LECFTQGRPPSICAVKLTAMQGINLDYAAPGGILIVALFFFWT